MRRLTSIVAVNEEGAIGKGNALPWRVRSDLQFFKEQTEQNVVIMGRRTFDSLGRPLPRRKNIVVTHGFGMFPSSSTCWSAGSISEALATAENVKTKREEVFIIGGASMYEQFAPFVDRYLITEVRKPVPEADTFFTPDIIGDVRNWTVGLLKRGQADGDLDEADYSIFELTLADPSEVARRRIEAISQVQARRSNNSLYPELNQLRAYA